MIDEFNFDYNKLKERDFKKLHLIILHHRAGYGDVYSINQAHKRRGFSGIGYHFYITLDGVVHEGRPVKYIGAHCKQNNSSSIGICLEGDLRSIDPTPEQITSLIKLVDDLKSKYPTIKRVLNHYDLMPTICPAKNLKAMIGEE